MFTMARHCILRCLLDTHVPIKLPHNIEVIIGRDKVTKIKDQSCSRQQLSLKANHEEFKVEVKQIGINPSGLEGFAMIKNRVYKVDHGSKIEILFNNYIHILEFEPSPDEHLIVNNKRKIEEADSTPQKKMAIQVNNVTDSEINVSEKNDWENIDNGELYIFTSKGVRSSPKIAAFDMDGTLITPKSGKVHPVDINDWQIAFGPVPKKLRELIDEGYKVVILSNQAPIGNGRVKIEDFKKKMENIVDKLNIPIQAYIATGRNFYRKPTIGMWNVLTGKKNDNIKVDIDQSFYCGDAVGRVANWAPGKKKDHSMADKLFAENVGLKFYTPEQFFLGHSIKNVPIAKPDFIPSELVPEPFNEQLISKEQEILVLVGFPGSGKSFFSKQIEKKSDHQYVSVCRDVLGSWQKCAAEAKRLLQKGKSVIVDSTNPDVESRGRWTSLAKEMNVRCRCAKMAASKAHAQHNNKYRELMKINHVPVNDIVFHTYKNKYVDPTPSEGFAEVLDVKFNPSFENAEAEKLYRMYLLEK